MAVDQTEGRRSGEIGTDAQSATVTRAILDTLAALECVGPISHLSTSEAYYPQSRHGAIARHLVTGGNSD